MTLIRAFLLAISGLVVGACIGLAGEHRSLADVSPVGSRAPRPTEPAMEPGRSPRGTKSAEPLHGAPRVQRAPVERGPVTIQVSCGGPLHTYVFRIPARTRARTVSRSFPELSPGDRCTVTETAHGATRRVRAIANRTRRTVTIPAEGEATVAFRDSFFPRRTAPAVTG
jgi:hypothetical protein